MTNLDLPPVQASYGMYCNAGKLSDPPALWVLQDRNLCIQGVWENRETEIKWIHIIVITYQLGIEESTWATNCTTK